MPVAVANPVHRQVETLAQELNGSQAASEAYILGGEDAPEVQDDIPEMPAIPVRTPAQRAEMARMPEPPAKEARRGMFGLFGRKKAQDDLRTEPAPARQPVQPRAAQPAAHVPSPWVRHSRRAS